MVISAIFLETNGKLWWTLDGINCERMDIFIKMKVRVKDVCCGRDHNLIIDENGNIWSWGYNYYGQCGNNTTKDIGQPQIIDTLKKMKIKEIQCGYVHSYCRTIILNLTKVVVPFFSHKGCRLLRFEV